MWTQIPLYRNLSQGKPNILTISTEMLYIQINKCIHIYFYIIIIKSIYAKIPHVKGPHSFAQIKKHKTLIQVLNSRIHTNIRSSSSLCFCNIPCRHLNLPTIIQLGEIIQHYDDDIFTIKWIITISLFSDNLTSNPNRHIELFN